MECPAFPACLLHHALEVPPEGMAIKQPRIWIDRAVAFERLQQPLEMVFKRAQPDIRQHIFYKPDGIGLAANEVGQAILVERSIAEERYGSSRKRTSSASTGQEIRRCASQARHRSRRRQMSRVFR